MILSGQTIQEYITSGIIGVAPEPIPSQYQPASLDLRLGEQLHNVTTDTDVTSDDRRVELRPGNVYLGHTLDYVSLPNHLAAMMTGRSSVGRAGVVVHKTAGWVDPGFSGELTLEMYNFTESPVTFDVTERIAQLVFLHTDRDSIGYNGQYQGQTGVSK